MPRPCGRGPAWPAGPAPLVRSSAPRGRVLPVLRPLTPRSLSTSQAPAGRVMEAQTPPHRVGAPWEGLSRAWQVPRIPSYTGLPLDQRAPVILDPGHLTEAPTKQPGFIYGALTRSTVTTGGELVSCRRVWEAALSGTDVSVSPDKSCQRPPCIILHKHEHYEHSSSVKQGETACTFA